MAKDQHDTETAFTGNRNSNPLVWPLGTGSVSSLAWRLGKIIICSEIVQQRTPRAMLPSCDRLASVARKDVSPVWTRSFPISKEPLTLGEHLRKRRFGAGIRQSEAALKLGVSRRTLSDWETDRVYSLVPAYASDALQIIH
jgi:DNA-binding XRE family transcriptional regulator